MTLPPLPALVREIENCITARHLDAALALCSNLRAAIAAVPAQPVLDCDIQPRPLAYPLTDYHRAGIDGPLHYTWQDKPHRLLYDLIAAVRYYAAPQAVPVPAGWVLVPVEPTEDMLFSAEMSKVRGYRDLYNAMLAAAPKEQPHE